MAAEHPTKNMLSPMDPTWDVPPPEAGAPAAPEPTKAVCRNRGLVALVDGADSGLRGETLSLLRRRLRLSAMILTASFAAFLVRNLITTDLTTASGAWLIGSQCLITLALGAAAGFLCRSCPISLPGLRVAEAAVFGLPLAFFAVVQYLATLQCCRDNAFFEFPAGPWMLLMYFYALFVPNPVRRASVAIGLFATVPVLLFVGLAVFHPEVRSTIRLEDITTFLLVIGVSAVASVFGVDTIGSLRKEVFEAKQLGQYRLKHRIGAGGMGEVFLAEHEVLKRPCVIKLIRPDKAGNMMVLERFHREVQATAKLTHWNTVEIFDYGSTEDGTFYYVMEHLPGMSLAELVEAHGPLPASRAIFLIRQVCGALAEAHSVGLVHRDIKPGNIFAAQRGGVYDVSKLLDFGLVKPIFEAEAMQLTAEGSITGSPLFMSPEQATGETEADVRSDIYSLGAVLYYLMTGKPPFEGTKPIKVIIAHAQEKVTAPTEHRPDLPRDLEEVILRCLAKEPKDRYQNVRELSDALRACRRDDDRWTHDTAAKWWSQTATKDTVAI